MIGFWLSTPRRFDPVKLDETPFGGAEISAINLARTLADNLNEEILIFGNIEKSVTRQPAWKKGKITFHSYWKLRELKVDKLICVRIDPRICDPRVNPQFLPEVKPEIIVWTGDEHTQPNNQILHDKWSLKEISRIVCKSNWQKNDLLNHFPLVPEDKIQVIYNGVNLDILPMPKTQVGPKFIYASTAFRGLHKFLKIWPMIRKRIPDATLDCYCKTTLYIQNNARESEFSALYEALRTLPGVMIFDPLPQKDFLNILPNYYAMLYPNSGFMESSCGVALESMACGVPVVTSAKAGLVETIKQGYGILVHENPESDEYNETFVKQTVKLWENKKQRDLSAIEAMGKVRKNYSWQTAAQDWSDLMGLTSLESQESWSESQQGHSATLTLQ